MRPQRIFMNVYNHTNISIKNKFCFYNSENGSTLDRIGDSPIRKYSGKRKRSQKILSDSEDESEIQR